MLAWIDLTDTTFPVESGFQSVQGLLNRLDCLSFAARPLGEYRVVFSIRVSPAPAGFSVSVTLRDGNPVGAYDRRNDAVLEGGAAQIEHHPPAYIASFTISSVVFRDSNASSGDRKLQGSTTLTYTSINIYKLK